MTIGQLREWVSVERPGEEIDDGYGGSTMGPPIVVECWARMQPLKGSETVIAARLAGVQPMVIHVRWTPDFAVMDQSWKVRHVETGNLYEVKAAANMDEKREFIEILAERTT